MPDKALVEKVARALLAARWVGSSRSYWDRLSEEGRDHYRRMARAAIETLKNGQ